MLQGDTGPSERSCCHDQDQASADPQDAPILAGALATDCSWLVTFNVRHYHRGQELQVGTPGEFINRLRSLWLG
ncbi:hypothetical protein BH23CHL7_BH23CHL7_12040 [soil metagenome]